MNENLLLLKYTYTDETHWTQDSMGMFLVRRH